MGIGFLLNPIIRSSSFKESQDREIWHLDFFQRTLNRELFNIGLRVEFLDNPKTAEEEKTYVAKAMWLPRDSAFSREDVRRQSSGFLRHTNALELSHIQETTKDREFITDRNGLVYISSDEHQFYRIVLCLALTVAYGKVIQRCIDRLVGSINTGNYSALSKLYKEVLSYNATDYFSQPVKLDRHELLAAWKTLKQHWHLDELNDELIQQLSGIAKLIEEERQKEEINQRHQFHIDQNNAWREEQKLRHQENQYLKQLRDSEQRRFEQEILNHKELTEIYREQKNQQAKTQQKIESRHKRLNLALVIITVIFTVLNTAPSGALSSLHEWVSSTLSLFPWITAHAVELWSWLLSHLG